jgi:hypothetical protein
VRISTLSMVIGTDSIAGEDVAGLGDLDCMAAHDSKWRRSAQDLFAASEATIDILQRVRYTVPDFKRRSPFGSEPLFRMTFGSTTNAEVRLR